MAFAVSRTFAPVASLIPRPAAGFPLGAFPTWLAPEQVHIIPVNEEAHGEYADDLAIAAIVRGIQPIAFDNAVWAYTLGAANAIKSGSRTAAATGGY